MPPDPRPIRAALRPAAGQWVKTAFTIGAAERYESGMVIVASLALATAALAVPLERVEPQAVAPERQAQATVTILAAAALRFSELEKTRPEMFRDTHIRTPGGSTQPARLVEFP